MESGDIFLIGFLAVVFIIAFVGQLRLCLKSEKVLNRLVPTLILVGIEVICIIIILVTGADSEAAEGI